VNSKLLKRKLRKERPLHAKKQGHPKKYGDEEQNKCPLGENVRL
jgi:hypothetical protein